MQKKAVVIGAGVGGLATAIRLAHLGYEVQVFEANDYAGGKLTAFELNGYRFDAGPSLFTMPFLVDEVLNLPVGNKPKFSYQKLEAVCHYFFPDQTQFKAYADHDALAKEIEQQLQLDAKPVLKHLEHSAFLYLHTAQLFMMRSLHQLKNYLKLDVLKALLNVHKLGLTKSMHQANTSALKHPKLVQIFNRFATYNGSDPYQAPAVMNIIPHLEHNQGAYLPLGGMHAITQALMEKALSAGVQFTFSSPVEQIVTNKGKATGVVVNGQTISANVVVSNMDIVPTYRILLPQEKAPEKTLRQPRSSSALIFYWGIKNEFPELGVHNILFSEDYAAEFNHIFKQNTIYHDPTVYINITSKLEKGDAPNGCENWFVMINVPSHQGQDWKNWQAAARKNILDKISKQLGRPIEPLIEAEQVLDPVLIQSKTSSHGGALYGAASNNRMAAFLRHPNFSNRIRQLYFVGGSVHPGGGIPLCLLSAKITADIISEKQTFNS